MEHPWRKAIIVGASGGIGEQIALALAQSGCSVALVGRNEAALQRIATAVNRADSRLAFPIVHDVRDVDTVPAAFAQAVEALEGIDLIVYAAGVMPMIGPTEYDTDKDIEMIAVNFVGAVAWINLAAKRFERAKEGTIVGIGSVSGDRGRKGNPVYGATKAALENYLESLRNRLAPHGASVVTVKPGPVETSMTAPRGRLPGMISAQRAAALILRAARRKNVTAYIPWRWWLVSKIIRLIPSPIFRRLKI